MREALSAAMPTPGTLAAVDRALVARDDQCETPKPVTQDDPPPSADPPDEE